jgi:hypothetical protein
MSDFVFCILLLVQSGGVQRHLIMNSPLTIIAMDKTREKDTVVIIELNLGAKGKPIVQERNTEDDINKQVNRRTGIASDIETQKLQ